MKKILTVIALLIVSCTTVFALHSDSAQGHRTLILVITPKTSKAYLDSVSSAWKANQVILTFTTLKYKHGQLLKVSGSVTTQWKSNVSGTFRSENLKSIEIIVTDRPSIDIQGK